MPLDQRQLRAFVTVVDMGSVGRASEVLGTSQSSLSRVIRSIEHRLHAPLFERHTKGMALTPEGEAFLPYARMLVFEMQQALDTIAEVRGLRRGHLRVGAVSSIAGTLLPDVLQRLRAAEPGLAIRIAEDDSASLLNSLTRREIDLAIAGVVEAEGVERIAALDFHDHHTVVCSRDHPLAKEQRVRLEDALGSSWVLPARNRTTRQLFEQSVRAAGAVPPEAAIETDRSSTYLAILAHHPALGWMASRLIENTDLVELRVAELVLAREYYLYRRQRGSLPAPARRMLDFLPLRSFGLSTYEPHAIAPPTP